MLIDLLIVACIIVLVLLPYLMVIEKFLLDEESKLDE